MLPYSPIICQSHPGISGFFAIFFEGYFSIVCHIYTLYVIEVDAYMIKGFDFLRRLFRGYDIIVLNASEFLQRVDCKFSSNYPAFYSIGRF